MCTSPSAREMVMGVSRTLRPALADTYPFWPLRMSGLPDMSMSAGDHISRSIPVVT